MHLNSAFMVLQKGEVQWHLCGDTSFKIWTGICVGNQEVGGLRGYIFSRLIPGKHVHSCVIHVWYVSVWFIKTGFSTIVSRQPVALAQIMKCEVFVMKV